MLVSVDEMKNYLRVDFDNEDELISHFLATAEKQCMDVMRTSDTETFEKEPNARIAVMYAAAYLYEHREEADHKAMNLTLRALLFGSRQEGF